MFKIFVTFLMVSTVLPVHARPQVVVGKPKIVYFKISLFPPPKYDVPYEGNLKSDSIRVSKPCERRALRLKVSLPAQDLRLTINGASCTF